MSIAKSLPPRSALFLPASNPRAIEKARTLDADLVILDLEDAVKPEDKDAARRAAVDAVAAGFGERLVAIRVNALHSRECEADLRALVGVRPDFVVVPKVEDGHGLSAFARPVLAMIETPRGVAAASAIAATPGVMGLIAGVNDLKAELGLPAGAGRAGLTLALQTIVLAARVARGWAIDGVFNALDDPQGLAAECAEGRAWGFDGKSLIHPGQIAAANAGFAPGAAEVEEARALIAAATGGAERFRGRMVEAMHVEQAKAVLARAGGESAPSADPPA